jgi:hypothetical protein
MSYSHRWSSNRGNTHADLLQFHKEAKNRSLLMLLLCVKRICSDKDAARMSDVLRDYAKVGFDVTTEWQYSQSIIQASLSF